MIMELYKLLWVDDEIELLKSHIIFLSEKGYEVDTASNGEDAISSVKGKNYDLILLDEMMAGMGGLET
jgi:DNA-binding response OmpR family regulator